MTGAVQRKPGEVTPLAEDIKLHCCVTSWSCKSLWLLAASSGQEPPSPMGWDPLPGSTFWHLLALCRHGNSRAEKLPVVVCFSFARETGFWCVGVLWANKVMLMMYLSHTADVWHNEDDSVKLQPWADLSGQAMLRARALWKRCLVWYAQNREPPALSQVEHARLFLHSLWGSISRAQLGSVGNFWEDIGDLFQKQTVKKKIYKHLFDLKNRNIIQLW